MTSTTLASLIRAADRITCPGPLACKHLEKEKPTYTFHQLAAGTYRAGNRLTVYLLHHGRQMSYFEVPRGEAFEIAPTVNGFWYGAAEYYDPDTGRTDIPRYTRIAEPAHA